MKLGLPLMFKHLAGCLRKKLFYEFTTHGFMEMTSFNTYRQIVSVKFGEILHITQTSTVLEKDIALC